MLKRYTHAVRLLLVLASLVLAGCGNSTKPVFFVDYGQVILAFGDSLTNGYGAEGGESYPEQLGQITGWTVVKSGVNGETTEEGLQRLPGVLQQTDPDVVLLCLGGNDFLKRKSHAQAQANLVELIRLIRDAGAQPILLAVPEPSLFGLSDHQMYKQLASQQGVPLIKNLIGETLKKAAWRADRIHPNAQGYAHIAQEVAAALGYRQ